jgi:hypothetical protein
MAPTVLLPEEEVLSAQDFLGRQNVRSGQPWNELIKALQFGTVALSATERVAPYLVESGPEGAVVVGRSVRLRASPDASAAVVATLDYEEVRILDNHAFNSRATSPQEPTSWARVRTVSGHEGYVFVGLLWTPGSPRFYFRRTGSTWRLVAYGDGD